MELWRHHRHRVLLVNELQRICAARRICDKMIFAAPGTDNPQMCVAVFTIAKGGLMYQAAVAGQKFSYTPK